MLTRIEHGKSFVTSGPGRTTQLCDAQTDLNCRKVSILWAQEIFWNKLIMLSILS